MRAQVITMSFLTLAACGDSGPIAGAQNVRPAWGPASNQLFSPEGPSGGLVGDWFPCADPSCANVESSGVRFTRDGWAFELERIFTRASDQLTYCVDESEVTKYSYSGETLTLSAPEGNDPVTYQVVIAGDRAQFIDPRGGAITILRIDPPKAIGPCDQNVPIPEVPPPGPREG